MVKGHSEIFKFHLILSNDHKRSSYKVECNRKLSQCIIKVASAKMSNLLWRKTNVIEFVSMINDVSDRTAS